MQHTERPNISVRQVNPWLQTNKATCTVMAMSCNQWWWTRASRKWKLRRDCLHAWGRYNEEKKSIPTSIHIETWNLSGICIWIYISASQQNGSSLSLDRQACLRCTLPLFSFFFLRGRTAWEKKKLKYRKVHPNQPAIWDVKQINARKPLCHMSKRNEMSTISCRHTIRWQPTTFVPFRWMVGLAAAREKNWTNTKVWLCTQQCLGIGVEKKFNKKEENWSQVLIMNTCMLGKEQSTPWRLARLTACSTRLLQGLGCGHPPAPPLLVKLH